MTFSQPDVWTVSDPTADALLTKRPDYTPEPIHLFAFHLQFDRKQ